MNIGDLTIEELRKLRGEIDDKIEEIKCKAHSDKVNVATENFVGKYIMQYDYDSYVDHIVKNMNKFSIYYITSVQNILYNNELVCTANVMCIDYEGVEQSDNFLTDTTNDAFVSIYAYTDNNCRIDISQEYKEISYEHAKELIDQAHKDAVMICDSWLYNTKIIEEEVKKCSKN